MTDLKIFYKKKWYFFSNELSDKFHGLKCSKCLPLWDKSFQYNRSFIYCGKTWHCKDCQSTGQKKGESIVSWGFYFLSKLLEFLLTIILLIQWRMGKECKQDHLVCLQKFKRWNWQNNYSHGWITTGNFIFSCFIKLNLL